MKRVLIFAVILTLGGLAVFYLWWSPINKVRPIYLVPRDAIFVIESGEPVANWKEVSSSEVWQHLRGNKTFAALTTQAVSMDSIIRSNSLFDFFGNRTLLISAHQYDARNYDFLFILDLDRASRLKGVKNYLNDLAGPDYEVTQRTYKGQEIIEIFDRNSGDNTYAVFVENLMLISFHHTLIEQAITEYEDPQLGRDLAFIEIDRRVGRDDIFRLYLQHQYLNDYFTLLLGQENEYIRDLSDLIRFTGFRFDMPEQGMLALEGFSALDPEKESYMHAATRAGQANHEIFAVAPRNSSFIMSLGFESFSDFVQEVERTLEQLPEQKKLYEENLEGIEKLLKIDVEEHFVSWVGSEVGMIQITPDPNKNYQAFALVIKAKEEQDARENLDFIRRQIKKRTPVKVKDINYKGYEINYLSLKGFFKVFFGKLFSKFDKPYYTVIENFVVFSHHPQTLKHVIDDYSSNNTLGEDVEFENFYQEFAGKSSAFCYVNSELLFQNLRPLVSTTQWTAIRSNKDFLVCFAKIGLEIVPDDDIFSTRLLAHFHHPSKDEILVAQAQDIERPKTLMQSLPARPDDEITGSKKPWKERYKDELDKTDDIIVDDLTARMITEKYAHGQLRYEMEVENGIKVGDFQSYFPDGGKQFVGKYKNDQKEGTWRVYAPEGKLIARLKFRRGRLEN